MIRIAVASLCLCATIAASDVVALTRVGNSVQLQLSDGYAEILWLGPSSVRVRQAWQEQPARSAQRLEKIPFTLSEDENSSRLRSRDLTVVLSKRPFTLRFDTADGEVLAEQTDPSSRTASGLDHRFRLSEDERLYGLGSGADGLDRRGTVVVATKPLLVSSEGYGVYFPGGRECRFDLGSSDPKELRVSVSEAFRSDYVVYYGGTPAHILEQHADSFGDLIEPIRAHAGNLSPSEKPAYAHSVQGTWPEVLRQIFQAGYSAMPVPAINPASVTGFRTRFGGDLLAATVPILLVPDDQELSPEADRLRRSFESHRLTYLMEARDRGLPLLHSMSYQFPFDPEAVPIEDQFFFGDEILVAPFVGSKNHRSVYLPQGIWTDWQTNTVTRGRQWISVSTEQPSLPMWVRNGSIVPVNRRDLVELHYFPKLGAEYFLWEPEVDEITQVHAGPAGDILRLQIEEKSGRQYEWVVHNVSPPTSVALGDDILQPAAKDRPIAPTNWRYDENRRNLHIRLEAKAGDDLILAVAFQSAGWFLH
jgi:hypothetical protein